CQLRSTLFPYTTLFRSNYSDDYVLLEDESFWLSGKRIDTNRTHGTGDTFAACVTSELAKGETLRDSIITAKKFIQSAVQHGIQVGHVHGPLNHWVELENNIKIIE